MKEPVYYLPEDKAVSLTEKWAAAERSKENWKALAISLGVLLLGIGYVSCLNERTIVDLAEDRDIYMEQNYRSTF